MASVGGHSVLVVPVPALEGCIRARWQHYDVAWVSRDPDFTHAHITALAPFLAAPTPDDLARVGSVAASVPAFDFVLDSVATFANGLIHLPPEPAAPFAELTARLWAEFPQCPPYDGLFDPVPHLTVDQTAPGVSEEGVRGELTGQLPVSCRADRLELHWYAEGDCRVLESWKLGAG
ncbi:MAG TPA: 2'-5' RNA ligase family protein [Nocardioides sp.]|nr:2'-5' RNA ligase family protein [Nocardioides sp.]